LTTSVVDILDILDILYYSISMDIQDIGS
jgi:hypothetical protein